MVTTYVHEQAKGIRTYVFEDVFSFAFRIKEMIVRTYVRTYVRIRVESEVPGNAQTGPKGPLT